MARKFSWSEAAKALTGARVSVPVGSSSTVAASDDEAPLKFVDVTMNDDGTILADFHENDSVTIQALEFSDEDADDEKNITRHGGFVGDAPGEYAVISGSEMMLPPEWRTPTPSLAARLARSQEAHIDALQSLNFLLHLLSDEELQRLGLAEHGVMVDGARDTQALKRALDERRQKYRKAHERLTRPQPRPVKSRLTLTGAEFSKVLKLKQDGVATHEIERLILKDRGT